VTAIVVDRSPHGLVVVSGEDATTFLQSLVSQDLDPIEDGASARSMLLTPQGKLGVVFRATRVGDEWWLDTDADFGSVLAESLNRYRIRVKVEIADRTETTGLVSVIGTLDPPTTMLAIPTTWGDVSGTDFLGPRSEAHETFELLAREHETWSAARFEAFRIEQGVPRLGVDLNDKTIPQEAFLDLDAVSFTKGCFLGQELVARIDSRGHVNRYLRRLAVDGTVVPPRGAAVIAGDGDKEVGAITSAAAVPDEDRVVALAMVRREIDPPADVTLRWEAGEAQAHVLASEDRP
jgi:tRNA-modifying protein YgfZ